MQKQVSGKDNTCIAPHLLRYTKQVVDFFTYQANLAAQTTHFWKEDCVTIPKV